MFLRSGSVQGKLREHSLHTWAASRTAGIGLNKKSRETERERARREKQLMKET